MAYFFKLPSITELTIGQQSALNEPNAIAISGGPGTGKSVVSLWRHIRNYGTGTRKSLLLTYTKTLEHYLYASAKEENVNAGNAIDRTLYWTTHRLSRYDEIIIDEAQDVENSRYNLIKNYAGIISYGADDQQILYKDKATTQQELAQIFPNNQSYVLDENFRNSYEIMLFAKALFRNKLIPQSILNSQLNEGRRGNKPILLVSGYSEEKQIKAIIDIINQFKSSTHNIAILVSRKIDVVNFQNIISSSGIQCSSYTSDDSGFGQIDNVHVTTFKSSKGTEFDTVIIPNFNEINEFLESDYYVAITRAKRNLFLISSKTPDFLERSEQQKTTYLTEVL